MAEYNRVTLDGDALIESIGVDDPRTLLGLLRIDLAEIPATRTLDAECEWQCSVERVWWPIRGRQLNLTDLYAVRWTDTAEAGVDDVTIVERVDDADDAVTLAEWLREIAANCGSCNGSVR